MEAQLEREGRRGGSRRASDWFARAATLPWHVLKGLGYAVPRALIMAVIAALGLSHRHSRAATAVCHGGYVDIRIHDSAADLD